MNKLRGFSLAELLGVIIVLGIIALITFPIVNNTIKSNKEKLYNSQLNEIKLSAEKWAYANLSLLPTTENDSITVTLLELKKSGFVPIDSRNPKTGELLPNDMIITITFKNNNYDIFVDGDSGTNLSNEFNENAPTIILNGSYIEYVEINDSYEEKGAKAISKEGSEVEVNITYQENGREVGSIDVTKFSTYTVIYSAISDGYTSNITRTVVVRDTTPPDLIVPDPVELTIDQLFELNLLNGVSATDNSGETINVETRGFDRLPTDKIVEYKACDSHNNCTIKRRIVKVIKNEDNLDIKVDLAGGMIPVYYDIESGVWKKADKDNLSLIHKWYDYEDKMWANAVSVTQSSRSNYMNAEVGTEISNSDILCFYVWIPRFKFKPVVITDIYNNAEKDFEKIENLDGNLKDISVFHGNNIATDIVFETKNVPKSYGENGYYTHPSFTYNGKELNGYWVGKYVTTGTLESPTILPEHDSIGKYKGYIHEHLIDIKKMQDDSLKYGFSTNQNIENVHIVHNIDYGAILYLTSSAYGLCVDNNKCYILRENHDRINSVDAIEDEVKALYSAYGYTGGITTSSEKDYIENSTTNNIYGIYDFYTYHSIADYCTDYFDDYLIDFKNHTSSYEFGDGLKDTDTTIINEYLKENNIVYNNINSINPIPIYFTDYGGLGCSDPSNPIFSSFYYLNFRNYIFETSSIQHVDSNGTLSYYLRVVVY